MNTSILIEVAQSKAKQVYSAGDFEVDLAQPVYLQNGDRFALSKTFIDTETESEGVVVIPKGGVTLTMSVQPYIQFDDATKFQGTGSFANNLDGVDNSEYLLYETTKDSSADTPGSELMELITSLTFYYTGPRYGKTWGNTDGAHPLKFIGTRIDSKGKISTFPVYVSLPALKTKEESTTGGVYYDGVFVLKNQEIYTKILQENPNAGNVDKDTSLVPDNTDGNWTYNLIDDAMGKFADKGVNVTTRTLDPSKGGFDLTPVMLDIVPFTIPEGKYTPQVLCTTINDELNASTFSKRVVDGIKNILPSPFLKQAFNFPMVPEPDFTPPAAGQPALTTKYILLPANPRFDELPNSNGGIAGFAQPTVPLPTTAPLYKNWLMGTNLMELQYSDETNKYYWNYLHMPIYDTSTAAGTIVSRIQQVDGSTPLTGKYIQQGKNGGVIFKDLGATKKDKNGKDISFDFWSGVLGFTVGGQMNEGSPDGLIPQTNRRTKFSAGTNALYSATIPTITDGVNTTNAGFVIDDIVNKRNYTTFDINKDGSLPNFEATSGFNNVIYATRSLVSNGILDTAYYLIEIQLNFSSNVIGTDKITKNISGIINRYYSKGSYVSAGGDPSFVVDYRGASTALSSMRVRILNPDGSLANIGKDNTLFFELIKAPPQIQPPPQQQQQSQK